MAYAKTRNFVDGSVTRLGPYISRGVVSTKKVYDSIRATGIDWSEAEKLIQELAWRDYWQQVWIARGNDIHADLRHAQEPVRSYHIPKAVVNANTGIDAIDNAILELYQTGYMHNHMRMYVASICCNIAQCHWHEPAKWLYAHLLDGDIASNQLSWQWVAGANANKKYYANQENINTFWKDNQKMTFLDVSYEQFDELAVPSVLSDTIPFQVESHLPTTNEPCSAGIKTLVYNYYNLDPDWMNEEDVQRVLLLEPSAFAKFPVSQKCIDFAISLAEQIPGMKTFVGEFAELENLVGGNHLHFKEHPLNTHYNGTAHSREWLSDVTGYYPSFFGFWKKCKRQLKW